MCKNNLQNNGSLAIIYTYICIIIIIFVATLLQESEKRGGGGGFDSKSVQSCEPGGCTGNYTHFIKSIGYKD